MFMVFCHHYLVDKLHRIRLMQKHYFFILRRNDLSGLDCFEAHIRTDRICILFLSYFPIQMIEAENHNIIPHPCIIFTDIFSDSDRLAFLAVCPGRIILCHKLCASTAKNTLRRKIDKPAFL